MELSEVNWASITKEHILNAIRRYDSEGHSDLGETKYIVVPDVGKEYPPLTLVQYALEEAYGTEAPELSDEESVFGSKHFRLLRLLGFRIKSTNILVFMNELKILLTLGTQFGSKAPIHNLLLENNTRKMDGVHDNLVPSLSFLDYEQGKLNGYFVAFLYYKRYNKLYLTFAKRGKISEYLTSNIKNPKCSGGESIKEYLKKQKENKKCSQL